MEFILFLDYSIIETHRVLFIQSTCFTAFDLHLLIGLDKLKATLVYIFFEKPNC